MRVPLRPELAAIPDPATLTAAPGLLNLAGNELPTAPPAAVTEAITGLAATVNRYPQIASADLTARIAHLHQVGPIQVAVGNGSANVLLQLLLAVCRPTDEVVFAEPSFEAYPALARIAGLVPVGVPLDPREGQADSVLAAIHRGRTRVAILCNPHNPTGALTRADELEDFLDRIPAHVLIVLDEAYHGFPLDPDRPDGVALVASGAWPNLVATRTLSKAHGLGGARIGYCVASPDIAAAARKCAVPYSVNTFAQAAGIAMLDNAGALRSTHDEIRHERNLLKDGLVDAGFTVPASHANFLWLQLDERAASFHEHCRNHKILVRLYPGHGVRVTVGRPEDNETFLAVARIFTDKATSLPTPQRGTAP